jgi:hypothetical protein
MSRNRTALGEVLRRELDQAAAPRPEPDIRQVYRLAARKRRGHVVRIAAVAASVVLVVGLGFTAGAVVRRHLQTEQMVQQAVETRLATVMERRSLGNVRPLVSSLFDYGDPYPARLERDRLFRTFGDTRWWRNVSDPVEASYP